MAETVDPDDDPLIVDDDHMTGRWQNDVGEWGADDPPEVTVSINGVEETIDLDEHLDRQGTDGGTETAPPASPFRERATRAGLLALGAGLGVAGWAIAGWVLGLFATALPIPTGARLGLAIGLFAIAAYYLAIDTGPDGHAPLDDPLGRWSR